MARNHVVATSLGRAQPLRITRTVPAMTHRVHIAFQVFMNAPMPQACTCRLSVAGIFVFGHILVGELGQIAVRVSFSPRIFIDHSTINR